ncbi:MAG: DUF5317 family protein [Dehalococcoidia bacterium]
MRQHQGLTLTGLVFVALGVQALDILLVRELFPAASRILLPISYLLVLGFALKNLYRPVVILIGLGAVLNFLAIVSNGGAMPVAAESLSGTDSGGVATPAASGRLLRHSKDIVLHGDDIRLAPLADRYKFSNAVPILFSVGDLFIVAGIVVGGMLAVGTQLLPRVRRFRLHGGAT